MDLPPKKTLKRTDIAGTSRFLTFSCYRRLRLFDNDRIKDRFVAHFRQTIERYPLPLIAWVVMPEHVHLIVHPSESTSIPTFLRSLKRPFATEVLKRWRELNASILPRLRDRRGSEHFWQAGGGYDRNVIGAELVEKIRYIHRNPIARGLSVVSDEWAWSSASDYRHPDTVGRIPIAFELVPEHVGELV